MTNNPSGNADSNHVKRKSVVREYTEAIFIALLLALFIRTFVIQAFKIPSGSMEETLLIGDHILVSKYAYGTHIPNEIPFLNIKLFDDIIFFSKAYAYIDPGTGSFLLQALLGAIAVAGATASVYWAKIKSFFSKKKKHDKEDPSD